MVTRSHCGRITRTRSSVWGTWQSYFLNRGDLQNFLSAYGIEYVPPPNFDVDVDGEEEEGGDWGGGRKEEMLENRKIAHAPLQVFRIVTFLFDFPSCRHLHSHKAEEREQFPQKRVKFIQSTRRPERFSPTTTHTHTHTHIHTHTRSSNHRTGSPPPSRLHH